jgi:hypothetical protein
MDAILNSIDNRDLALCFWLLVLLGWILWKPSFRRSRREFLRALLQRQILVAFGLAALTTALLSYTLSLMGLWTLSQLKGSFVWFIVACIPSIMDVPKLSEDFSLFRKAALKNFQLSVFADFYINLFHAPFLVEVVLLPVATAITAMIVIAERREDLKPAHSILTNTLAFIGLSWAAFQAFKLFTSFNQVLTLDTLRDFILPIALNLAFLPFLVLYAVYAAYDSVFARVRFVVKPPALHRYTKFVLMARCGLNYMRINRWFKRAWHLNLDSRSSIWQSIGGA